MRWRAAFAMGLFALSGAAPSVARAQPASRSPVVGFFGSTTPAGYAPALNAFRAALRQHGYEEGKNVVVEYRWAEGKNERYPALVDDVLRLDPLVLVSECGPALRAIRDRSRSVPVVVAACADATHFHGEIASLARPGGQTTGFTFLAPEATGKRFEILQELRPGLTRLAVLHTATEPWSEYWTEMRQTARRLNLTLQQFGVRDAKDFERAFADMARNRIDAVVTLPDALTTGQRGQIAELAKKHRLPTAFDIRAFVMSGGLMSYGPSVPDLFRRAASYVDRSIKGAKPGDLPVQQPTTFELVINVRTAKALGLTIPPAVTLRADHVIE